MKKTLLIAIIGMMSFNLGIGQELWFDAGVKGSWGPTFLLNQNLTNNSEFGQQISTGYSMGGKFGFNFGYIHGITFDAMYSQNSQTYSPKDLNPFSVDWNNIDLYLLYRVYRTINYLEIGPKYSLVNTVRNDGVETTQYYTDQYASAVLGFGWYVFGRETFTATLGMRIEYGFVDMISGEGKSLGFPVNPVATTAFEPYKPTNPVIAQVVFELNWGIGYFAKTACAGRKHFFAF